MATITDALGGRHAGTFDGCTEHTPREGVIAAAVAARAVDADLIVTVGGGSAIDAAKALLLCLAEGIGDAEALGAYRLQIDAERDPANIQALLSCQLAVGLATVGLNRAPFGACHGIGHQLGAVAGVPHWHCTCVLQPAVMRYNAQVNGERQTMAATAMGAPETGAAEAIENLVRDLEQPTRLRDVGVKQEQFEAIANSSLDNLFARSNPRPITVVEEIIEILQSAW